MMTDVVEERSKNPRCKGFGQTADGMPGLNAGEAAVLSAAGDNPFCGDSIEMRVRIERDSDGVARIVRGAFEGYACSLCTAAADVLLEHVAGMSVDEALAVGYDGLIALLGGPVVGRTRSGCVRLPVTVLARALGALGR